MNILVDENCLWLAREPALTLLKENGYNVQAIGGINCPAIGSDDWEIVTWLQDKDFAILTHDFDDFYERSPNIVVFGIISRGVFTSRVDIIIDCLKNCRNTFGPQDIPPGLYVLTNYHW
jgi:hypothetical protein